MISTVDFLTRNAALIVSLCALFLTITELFTARKHNRLSVKPLLTTFTSFDIDSAEPDETICTAHLLNTGLGPAIIKEFEFLLDNNPLRIQDPQEMNPVLFNEFGQQLVSSKTRTTILRKMSVLAKDQKLMVAKLVIKSPTSVQLEAIKRFNLWIKFESAYGESFIYDSRLHTQTKVSLSQLRDK